MTHCINETQRKRRSAWTTLSKTVKSAIMLSPVLYWYAECRYAECRGALQSVEI